MSRPPGSPLDFERTLKFEELKIPLDTLVDRAEGLRQEILEAALSERNSNTALQLAKMEYLPDFTVSYFFDHYLLASAAPGAQSHRGPFVGDRGQRADLLLAQAERRRRARTHEPRGLALRPGVGEEPDRGGRHLALSLRAVRLPDGASCIAQSLIPLANEDFEVALTAYQSGRISFVELAAALRRGYDARVSYLQAANQFVANRVALEQAVGAPLGQ